MKSRFAQSGRANSIRSCAECPKVVSGGVIKFPVQWVVGDWLMMTAHQRKQVRTRQRRKENLLSLFCKVSKTKDTEFICPKPLRTYLH